MEEWEGLMRWGGGVSPEYEIGIGFGFSWVRLFVLSHPFLNDVWRGVWRR